MSELKEHLGAGRLVAFGRAESPSVAARPVAGSVWQGMEIEEFEQLISAEGPNTKIFNVRVFPVLLAPNAVDCLDGVALAEACRRFVFEDPQLAVLRKRAIAIGGRPQPFGYWWPPYGTICPIDFGDISAWDCQIGIMHRFDEPEKFTRTRIADYVLGERFARLVGYLRRGELVAEGIANDGHAAVVPKSMWQRAHTHLDVSNGDLLDLVPRAQDQTEALSEPMFIGLLLRKLPESVLHVKPPAYDGLRRTAVCSEGRSNRPRPVADELGKVLANMDVDALAQSHCWTAIASQVGPKMPNPPRTETEVLALTKAVKRHFQAKGI